MKYILTFLLIAGNCYGSETARRFGDVLQIASPIVGIFICAQTGDHISFASMYLVSMGIVGLGKQSGKQWKYPLAQRPDNTAYTGMPSGHTASAWTAAAYTRNPFLYASAIVTGYSRVVSKRHTVVQVAASIVIVEVIRVIQWRYFDCNFSAKMPIVSISHRSFQLVWAF